MQVANDLVKHIAHLARIQLDEAELTYYAQQLEAILSYVEKINELDLEKITPTRNPHQQTNVYREDSCSAWEDRQALLSLFPEREDSFIKIPKVIE